MKIRTTKGNFEKLGIIYDNDGRDESGFLWKRCIQMYFWWIHIVIEI